MFTDNEQFYLQILIAGRPLEEYPYQGEHFIVGTIGQEFTLRLGRRDLTRRGLAVVSVDGLSIMTGKPASSSDGGYIIEKGAYIDIPGWRLNNAAVASFYFATLPAAYAAQMGKPANIGVIGAKFFYEEVPISYSSDASSSEEPPPPPSPIIPSAPLQPAQNFPGVPWGSTPPAQSSTPAAPAPASPPARMRPQTSPGVGTGFGREQTHTITTVSFERDRASLQSLILRYDTAENLQARGILLTPARDRVLQANPFPADEPGCTPPPNWRG